MSESGASSEFAAPTYAEWVTRLLSTAIDLAPVIILWIISQICKSIFTTTTFVIEQGNFGDNTYSYEVAKSQTSPFGIFLYLLFLVLAAAFWFWNKGAKEGTTGQSIGKQIVGCTTLNEETGHPLGTGPACLRAVLFWVDWVICFIGLFWPLWDPKRQTLISDRVTKAVVYKD